MNPHPINDDMVLEIISRCSSPEMAKLRLLSKEFNKRTHEYFFIDRHIRKTNSVLGYFNRSNFVSCIETEEGEEEAHKESKISLAFLPSKDAKMEACDTRHGVLLCVDDRKYKGLHRIPDYIVCKPATKEYRIIPNPKTRYFTIATGLIVVRSNPFRYKIVRVSEPLAHERRKIHYGFWNLHCEVFDSDSFAWKRLKDLELPIDEFFPRSGRPVWAYGFLHWLTRRNNVIRFCMQTETWSVFPGPADLLGGTSLVWYEGKLGVVNSTKKGCNELWVLEGSFGKSWINVKTIESRYVEPLWFPSNDVVLVATGFDELGLYNRNSNKYRHLDTRTQDYYVSSNDWARDHLIPFYSNYNIVGLDKQTAPNSKADAEDPRTLRIWFYLYVLFLAFCFFYFLLLRYLLIRK